MAEPQAWHRVEAATDDVGGTWNFTVTKAEIQHQSCHSSIEAVEIVPAGKALDLGCRARPQRPLLAAVA